MHILGHPLSGNYVGRLPQPAISQFEAQVFGPKSSWVSLIPPFSPVRFGTASPTVVPNYVGETFVDTLSREQYFSVGNASAADWEITN